MQITLHNLSQRQVGEELDDLEHDMYDLQMICR